MRFRVWRYFARWYVEDTLRKRHIVGVGPDARPSNEASLTPDEASAIAQTLNILYGTES